MFPLWEFKHGEWYSLYSVPSFPWYIGMGWREGIQAWGVVWFGMFLHCPFCPMVHWDGMDSRNSAMGRGMVWDVPTLSLLSQGTLGWDGHWEFRHGEWYGLGCFYSVPSFPWYIGMGWTEEIQAWGVVRFGIFLLCLFLPMVHWDEMDSGNSGMESGMVWGVPTLSLPSHDTLG